MSTPFGRRTHEIFQTEPQPHPHARQTGDLPAPGPRPGRDPGGESILRDITFQLNCREIVALIGPNGAGKSSLFRSILGQIPYSGSIQFQLAGGYPSHPKIGYVPQSPSFDRGYPISVLDFFAAAISRWPVFLPVPGHLRDKVTECLARVHGEALIQKRIGTLSGGELQRVLLALALEPIPQILILDEPLSGVDVGRASAAGYAGRDPAEI